MGLSTLYEDGFYPFGRGTLTEGGTQYGTAVTAAVGSTWTAVDTFTMYLPHSHSMSEMEFYLQGSVASASSSTIVKSKWQGSDDGTNFADLSTAQERAAATGGSSYADTTACSGKWGPSSSTNFPMSANTLYVRFVVCPDTTTSAVMGKTKGTSYIKPRYWLM